MNEQEFIYSKLKFLSEQVDYLTDLLVKQQDVVGNLVNLVDKMASPDYARKQVKTAEMMDIADKLAFIKSQMKK